MCMVLHSQASLLIIIGHLDLPKKIRSITVYVFRLPISDLATDQMDGIVNGMKSVSCNSFLVFASGCECDRIFFCD